METCSCVIEHKSMVHDGHVRVARARETERGGRLRTTANAVDHHRSMFGFLVLSAPPQRSRRAGDDVHPLRRSHLPFSHLEKKVQKLESQQRGELESMREEKSRLQVPCTRGAAQLTRVRASAQVSCDRSVSSLWSGTRWQPSSRWSCSCDSPAATTRRCSGSRRS